MKIRCRKHRGLEVRLLQVALDPALSLLVQRSVGYNAAAGLPLRGGWESHTSGLLEGVYCSHCLKEGVREPLDLDELEYDLLGRVAFYYPPATELSLDEVWPAMARRFQRQIVTWQDTNARGGIYAPVKAPLPAALRAKLESRFPRGLYRHQTLAVETALGGSDVVVATPTASGKSVCYVLPILAKLLEEPDATALYLAPTQSLAEDQFDQWLGFSSRQVSWEQRARRQPEWHFMREVTVGDGPPIRIARYDGGTDNLTPGEMTKADLRRRIRAAQPRILITTPEMLHTGILGHPERWVHLLRGLRYIVLDEMHSYKGLFGSSMAQIIRRLLRRCQEFGARPQFIGCSATIRNPEELAAALMGRVPEVIGPKKDGSPRKPRRFVIMDSARAEEPVLATARNLMVELVRRRRLRTIAFTRSISEADTLYNRAKESLREHGMEELLTEFKAVLPAHEKRALARGLRSGRTAAVVSTNGLELGLDIGELSAAVLVKFPGSMSSLLQQAGRVGRRGEGLIFLLADENPLNQFFVQHPDEFFAMAPEEVYLDPNHNHVVADHLVCAASETPLDPVADQAFWGPNLPALADQVVSEGRLSANAEGRLVPSDPEFFPSQIGLRTKSFFMVPIMHMGTELTRESGERAPRTLHRFARIQLQDALYEVESLRINWTGQTGRADVRLVSDRDFITVPFQWSDTEILEVARTQEGAPADLAYGKVLLTTQVIGYYKVPIGARAKEEERPYQLLGGSAPPAYGFSTQATWITLPQRLVGGIPVDALRPMMHSLQKALVLAACIHLRCDPGDLDGVAIADERQIFLYDSQSGGSGLAAKVYEHFSAIWATARQVLEDCPFCNQHPESRGCPKCVTDEFGLEDEIDRQGALRLLQE